jgi:hypothetical protein
MARQQGGEVHLERRQPGQPTRFVLTLPRITPPENSNSPPLVESLLAAPLAPAAEAANGFHTS